MNINNFAMTNLMDRIERLELRDREEVRNRGDGDICGVGAQRGRVGNHASRNEGARIEDFGGEEQNDYWDEDFKDEYEDGNFNQGCRGDWPLRGRGVRGRGGGRQHKFGYYGAVDGNEERVDCLATMLTLLSKKAL
ncbi:hypothetical protein GH714_041506 [Hevea brasiliensis]|uniref:Uncharacterized protein n=1 Tax=Hevea brasiliensis TaxID=3981 RepID=A0A6A6MUB0_HEVBR|nr:hypothetical protein GH714_041506 [Hevea brasiliensis]